MNKMMQTAADSRAGNRGIRLGFVPLSDCAPLAVAQEFGFFHKYGLRVELCRELGWATIRDKIIHRELDATQALAAMPVTTTLGLGSAACACVTALVLNLNGNAITLSNELWKRGVRDGKTLREEIQRVRREKTFTFGVGFPFSSHRHLLRRWFAALGIDPERDVRIVIVPPPQMVANLKAGHLDGFCAAEPWNSVAVQLRAGWIVAASTQLDPLHPEKVLMVRADYATSRGDEHVALVAALLEACEYCDEPCNHEAIIRLLARPEYVGVDESALRQGIAGTMDWGHGIERGSRDFCIFHRDDANRPSGDKAAWVLDLVRASGFCPEPSAISFAFAKRVFRSDIFESAVELRRQNLANTLFAAKTGLKAAPAFIPAEM